MKKAVWVLGKLAYSNFNSYHNISVCTFPSLYSESPMNES